MLDTGKLLSMFGSAASAAPLASAKSTVMTVIATMIVGTVLTGLVMISVMKKELDGAKKSLAVATEQLNGAVKVNQELTKTIETVKLLHTDAATLREDWLQTNQRYGTILDGYLKKLPKPSGKDEKDETKLSLESQARLTVLWQTYCETSGNTGKCPTGAQ